MSAGRLKIKVFGAVNWFPHLRCLMLYHKEPRKWAMARLIIGRESRKQQHFLQRYLLVSAQEMSSWIHYGGGLELWRELYEEFNLVPFAAGNTGVQMTGWFNKEIKSIEDIKGLRMRTPGLGGDVITRAGGIAVTISGGELYAAMQTGVIDALEWVGPYNDLAFGFHQMAKYYYYPGWSEPGPALELLVNKDAFETLPEDLKAIVETAARAVNQDVLDEYTARNNEALVSLIEEHGVQLKKLPDDVVRELRRISEEIIEEIASTLKLLEES